MRSTGDFFDTQDIQVYGAASGGVLEMMRQLASSGAPLSVKPVHLGGFTRARAEVASVTHSGWSIALTETSRASSRTTRSSGKSSSLRGQLMLALYRAAIRDALACNLCRCTGYQPTIRAVQHAAAEMRA